MPIVNNLTIFFESWLEIKINSIKLKNIENSLPTDCPYLIYNMNGLIFLSQVMNFIAIN